MYDDFRKFGASRYLSQAPNCVAEKLLPAPSPVQTLLHCSLLVALCTARCRHACGTNKQLFTFRRGASVIEPWREARKKETNQALNVSLTSHIKLSRKVERDA